ncbi:MAG TPA: M14 family metallopeptidase, partial [Chthoniobacterales bacterium]|nr:M14 family metallopeptidase [Chthoniobacterales bacterium]
VQGGIHAGEIDGKDAGFLLLREALERKDPNSALAKQVMLFIPVFNVDGHERFGPWNRMNQRGPREMGWRTTAQNYNLNRDYVKADAPEMQAMLRLLEEWDPLVCMDLHVTDGAKFEHHLSVQVEPLYSGDEELRKIGLALREETIAALSAKDWLPLNFYPSFMKDDEPQTGFEQGVAQPRFSTGYFPLRNRFCMLVETHSWKDYPTRVRATHDTIAAVLALIAEHGSEWRKAAHDADKRATQLAGQTLPLTYEASETARTIQFRGYEYTRTMPEVSGALMTRYDEAKPQIWDVPLREDVRPAISVTLPAAGYLVPVAHAEMVGEKLRQHGIAFEVVKRPLSGVELEVFRATKLSLAEKSFEGHQELALEGEWKPERRDLLGGALFVPIAQPKARLVAAMLEPRAPDSLAAWGYFNAMFEQKEFMEAYVAEEIAREMLAKDTALAAEFQKRLAEDPEFAKSSSERLQFFARRHPSWDDRINLYPIFRTATKPN